MLLRALLTTLLIVTSSSYAAGIDEIMPVWVDTDLACGTDSSTDASTDVDDCLALAILLTNPRVHIVGISLVFGNADLEMVQRALNRFQHKYTRSYPNRGFPPVYLGANRAWTRWAKGQSTAASRNLAKQALVNKEIIVVSLGPLTNIATAMQNSPEIQTKIKRLIWVGGTRQNSRRFFPGNTRLMSFRDFNLIKDKPALEFVFNSNVPLQLAGYELGASVTFTGEAVDLLNLNEPLNQYLKTASTPWQRYWKQNFSIEGFYAFDLMAVRSLLGDSRIQCTKESARLKKRWFTIHSLQVGAGSREVWYCVGV